MVSCRDECRLLLIGDCEILCTPPYTYSVCLEPDSCLWRAYDMTLSYLQQPRSSVSESPCHRESVSYQTAVGCHVLT